MCQANLTERNWNPLQTGMKLFLFFINRLGKAIRTFWLRGARVLFDDEVKTNGSQDRLFRKLEAAERLITITRNPLDLGTEVISSPGDFHYVPSVSIQAPAGGVPDKFHQYSSSPSALRASIGLPSRGQQGQSNFQTNDTHGELADYSPQRPSPIGLSSSSGSINHPRGNGPSRNNSSSNNGSAMFADDGEYIIFLVTRKEAPHMFF
jgi:hypothetical protein